MKTGIQRMESQQDVDILSLGRRIVEIERDGLTKVLNQLDQSFSEAIRCILECQGRVAVTGMGKAGLIGAKIAATLSSTGTPSYLLHPAEAIHGDLGMVCPDDVILALSNSGESEELERIIPALRSFGCQVILITGRRNSRCAQKCDMVIDIGAQEEACPLGMAPSSSTTAMLAVGDAIALALSELKGFEKERYVRLHPGGALGRSLMRVEELMRTGENCIQIDQHQTVQDYISSLERAPSRAGAAAVVDHGGQLVGFFSNGDLRRLVLHEERPGRCPLKDVMTANPKHVRVGDRVAHALEMMRQHRIDEIPVVDHEGHVVGLIDIQDIVSAGFSLFDVS